LLLFSCKDKEKPQDLHALSSDDGQWVMPAKNYASTRYSGLDQINASNVKNLHVVWTLSTGHDRGHEAAPLVIGDTMYFVTPFPNELIAIDLKDEPGTRKWTYRPEVRLEQRRSSQRVADLLLVMPALGQLAGDVEPVQRLLFTGPGHAPLRFCEWIEV